MNSTAVHSEKTRRAAIIRDEERKLMQYEDERRRRYVKERKATTGPTTLNATGVRPPLNESTRAGYNNSSSNNNYNHVSDAQNEGNIQAAALWWSALRPLTLGGRSRREYLWRVIPEYSSLSSLTSSSLDNSAAMSKRSFLLQWVDPQQQQTPLGTIILHELKDITMTGDNLSAVTLQIGESAKAIRGTGGRTTVVIECATQSEAMKYMGTLQTLRNASEI